MASLIPPKKGAVPLQGLLIGPVASPESGSAPDPTRALIECGVDECGVGSAIAEVYAASCILNPKRRIRGLKDSKQLTPKRRQELNEEIRTKALDFCVATASLEEIEQFNVFGATLLAMTRAVEGLKLKPDIVLIDGNRMPKLPFPARTIIKGDAKIKAISAASILAKVARDEAMVKYHEQFPQYGFAEHKGYLTAPHFAALKQFGPCSIHRKGYEPIRSLLVPTHSPQQLDLLLEKCADEHGEAHPDAPPSVCL
jgi:ribonuclease HII